MPQSVTVTNFSRFSYYYHNNTIGVETREAMRGGGENLGPWKTGVYVTRAEATIEMAKPSGADVGYRTK